MKCTKNYNLDFFPLWIVFLFVKHQLVLRPPHMIFCTSVDLVMTVWIVLPPIY